MVTWAIVLKENQHVIGKFQMEEWSDEHHHAAVGYLLGKQYWGKGYATEALRAVMAYLFKNLWVAANQPGGTVAQILYIQVSTTGMRALTHQTIDFLPGFIYSAIFIGLVALYARE